MDKLTLLLDKTAIGLSAICVIHCLALPLALILLPSLAALPLADESFHKILIYLVLPTSVVALTFGCKKHEKWRVLGFGFSGLAVLLFGAFFGHDLLGHDMEKVVTVFGATLVATGHVLNFRHCQTVDCQHG